MLLTAGLYAVEFTIVALAEVPVLADIKATSHQLLLLRLEQTATGWRGYQTMCDIQLEGGPIAQAEIPDAFVSATGSKWTTVTMENGRYTADLGINHAGWRLEDEGEELPTDIDDPRIYDWDNDGQPAATIWIHAPLFGRVDVQVVQKTRTYLEGYVTGPTTAEGHVRLQYLQQRTVDASNFLFKGNLDLKPQEDLSHWRLWKVAEDMTCEKLISAYWSDQ